MTAAAPGCPPSVTLKRRHVPAGDPVVPVPGRTNLVLCLQGSILLSYLPARPRSNKDCTHGSLSHCARGIRSDVQHTAFGSSMFWLPTLPSHFLPRSIYIAPRVDRLLLVVFIFPQVAKLLGFLLQIYEELHVCILEQACWCRCRVPLQVPLQGAA